jgi:streptogramin lyase/alpha/beta superfamily hydrolase
MRRLVGPGRMRRLVGPGRGKRLVGTIALLSGVAALGGCLGDEGDETGARADRGVEGERGGERGGVQGERGGVERGGGPGAACGEVPGGRVSVPAGTGSVPVGGYANLLAVGGGSLWVPVTSEAAPEQVRLVRIRFSAGAVSSQLYQGTGEVRLRVGLGAVWLADPGPRTLTRLDLRTAERTVRRPFGAGIEPRELTLGAGRVWLVPGEGGFVAEVDPDSMQVVRRISLNGVHTVGDVAVDGRTLWASAPEEGRLVRVDARSGQALGDPIRVGAEPIDIEAADDDVWVDLGEGADALAHVDARSGRVLGRVPNGGSVFALALGFGSVWATNYKPDTVTRIDAATGRRLGRPIPTGTDPKGVVTGAGAVWVANAGSCTVTRINPSNDVSFRTADGVRLEGRIWGDGRIGIVFSHMGRGSDSQVDWYPLARELAARGYTTLTYNRRGVCPGAGDGCSGGSDDLAASWRDVVAADRFLRARGARVTVLVGASIGAMSSLRAAATGRVDPVALVELAGVNHASGYDFTRSEIARIQGAKLFVSAADDPYGGDDSAREWHRWARPPKDLAILKGYAHGTDLLAPGESTARRVRRLIVRFVERHVPG